MDVQAGLSMNFHDMDVANGELHEDTQSCESQCFEQQRQKDILLDGEICQRFMELWHAKRELLIYKAFVTRFPNCALWYDQISGSIPPETEIEIVTSEMFDSGSDTCSIPQETEIEIVTSEMFDSGSDTCLIPPETEIEIVTSEMFDNGSDTSSMSPETEIEIVTSEMFDSGSDTSSMSPETEIEIVTSEMFDSSSDTCSIPPETEIEIVTSEMFDNGSDTCSIPPETEIEIVTSEMFDSGSDTCSIPPETEIEIVTSEMFDSGSDTCSIPPETEIEIVTSEMFDSGSDTSNEDHLFAESGNKELVCYIKNDKDHLYSNANSKEHLHNYARSAEHSYCYASSKEPRASNWEERVFSQASNEDYTHSQIDNTEQLYDESVRKEHIYSATSNKEHFHSDKNNKEHLQHSVNENEILCRGLQIENLQHENCNSEHGTDVQGNVLEVTNTGNQVFSNSKECINDDCESKEEICQESSNIIHSKLDQHDSCPTKLPVAGEVTLKHNIISEADLQTGGHFTEARDFPFQAENCSHSCILIDDVVSSASEASSVADSAIQSVVEEVNISYSCSDSGIELAVQLVRDEHGYASWGFNDHSYTDKADLPYSSGHCQDCFAVDGQDAAEEFGHGELMARLQEAHEDLKSQVFLYVREIFSEWVRGNPGEEFDVSSLDRDLLAVATPFMQVQFVDQH